MIGIEHVVPELWGLPIVQPVIVPTVKPVPGARDAKYAGGTPIDDIVIDCWRVSCAVTVVEVGLGAPVPK